MTVLITGVNGFVGRHLAGLLRDSGRCEIWGTYLQPAGDFNIPNINLRCLDISDAGAIISLLEDIRPAEIYHLAAISATSGADPTPYYKVNFSGTVNLLEGVRKVVPQCRVLFIGSANVYGRVPVQQQPIKEDLEFRPVNHYASSKAAADMAAFCYAANGLNVVRVRPFNHTGPGQNTDFVCSRIAKQVAEIVLGRQEPLIEAGNISAARDFTDVRDVIEAYRLLMKNGRSGEAYNICSQQVYSVKEIIEILANWAGVEVKVKSREDLLRSTDIAVLRGSNKKITAETGWQQVIDFRQTLRDLLVYWKHKLIN